MRESNPRLATLLNSNWLTKWHEIFRPIAIRSDALIINTMLLTQSLGRDLIRLFTKILVVPQE